MSSAVVMAPDANERSSHLEGAREILTRIRAKGVEIWVEQRQLHYRAPNGVLTDDDINSLRANKQALIGILEAHDGHRSVRSALGGRRIAPPAFSQLAHWNLYRLSRRPAIRQIASAIRLKGPLDIGLLRQCLRRLAQRHEALRTQIVMSDGFIQQHILEVYDPDFTLVDMSQIPPDSFDTALRDQIDALILEPVDVAIDPLWKIVLVASGENEHVLVLAMEHMISDAFSMNILLEEMFHDYAQALNAVDEHLAETSTQFSAYSQWARGTLTLESRERLKRLTGVGRLRFPADGQALATAETGWGLIPVRGSRELTAGLRQWSRSNATTLVTTVLTAYTATVLRWCNAQEVVIQYQSDGRFRPEFAHTIGYLASMLYLHLQLRPRDTFVDLLRRITDEYCTAYECADHSYLEAQVPPPEVTKNSAFNWVPTPEASVLSSEELTRMPFECSMIEFEHPMLGSLERDNEPCLLISAIDGELVGGVYFPRNRFSDQRMERFSRNFIHFMRELAYVPDKLIADVALV